MFRRRNGVTVIVRRKVHDILGHVVACQRVIVQRVQGEGWGSWRRCNSDSQNHTT